MFSIKNVVGTGLNSLAALAPRAAGRLSLDLFCRPISGRNFTKKELAYLNKSTWEPLYFQGKKIQCYVWGEGKEKVFLAHGFNSNAARWRILGSMLEKKGYQVIAMDVPAHGHSDWKRVNGLLYAQTFAQAMQHYQPDYVVGHSFAGIALSYYFTQMECLPVQKIIMMGVPDELRDVTNVFFKELGLKSTVQRAYDDAFKEKFGYPTEYFTLSNMVKQLSFPGLIIHDEQDDVASFEGAKRIYENWPNASFFSTDRYGHSLQGRPVYNAIVQYLEN